MRQTLLHGAHITAQTLDPSPEKDRHVCERSPAREHASLRADRRPRRPAIVLPVPERSG